MSIVYYFNGQSREIPQEFASKTYINCIQSLIIRIEIVVTAEQSSYKDINN